MEISVAHEKDIPLVIQLCHSLKFDIVDSKLRPTIGQIIQDNNQILFIVKSDNRLLGFLHAIQATRLSSEPFTEIVGLFILEEYQNRGIGKKLLSALKSNQEARPIRVRCNSIRTVAHSFYNSNGFDKIKEQMVFLLP